GRPRARRRRPAPAAALAVDAFSASPSTVSCEGDRTADRPVSLSWSTSGGTAARLATGTTGTAAGDPVELAASGYGLTVACRDSETLVALTVEAADGSTVQRTLVITAED
ncbi:hypothetical protein, partial [Rathayibacter sp. VKM Ac-2630]|uniref:hypothetical protein n=1 Tax=Rathayibacter sp. VKM Ac-2630 TaxID=1938617 RepID=UPI0009CC646D